MSLKVSVFQIPSTISSKKRNEKYLSYIWFGPLVNNGTQAESFSCGQINKQLMTHACQTL